MVEQVPPTLEAKVRKLVELRNQLAVVQQQVVSLEGMLAELERTLEAVKDLPDDAVLYKMVGGVLVKTDKKSVVDELSEKIELTKSKLAKSKKLMEDLQSDIKRLEAEIQSLMAKGAGKAGGGSAG